MKERFFKQDSFLDKIMSFLYLPAFLLMMFSILWLAESAYKAAFVGVIPLILLLSYKYGKGEISIGEIINIFIIPISFIGFVYLIWKDKFIGGVLLFPLTLKLFYMLGKRYSDND